jgi:hypothetical protein
VAAGKQSARNARSASEDDTGMRTRPTHISRLALVAGVAAALLLTGPFVGNALAAHDRADAVETFGRDVFFIEGSTLRNPDDTTPPAAVLFNNSGVPLEVSPGQPLTWGRWKAAGAASTAKVLGGVRSARTDVRMDLTGLVPGGRYSIFWGTLDPDSEQPLCAGVERTLPLDAVKPAPDAPDANSFIAGASGSASYHGVADADLFGANQVFVTVVYHFLGRVSTYPFPNLGELQTQGPNCHSSFGEDAMRQLIVLQKW